MGNLLYLSNYFFLGWTNKSSFVDLKLHRPNFLHSAQLIRKQNSSKYAVCIEQIKKYFMRFRNWRRGQNFAKKRQYWKRILYAFSFANIIFKKLGFPIYVLRMTKAILRLFILEIQNILVKRYGILCIANYMITNTLSDKKLSNKGVVIVCRVWKFCWVKVCPILFCPSTV